MLMNGLQIVGQAQKICTEIEAFCLIQNYLVRKLLDLLYAFPRPLIKDRRGAHEGVRRM